jgi:hypothetical protein
VKLQRAEDQLFGHTRLAFAKQRSPPHPNPKVFTTPMCYEIDEILLEELWNPLPVYLIPLSLLRA